MTVTAMMSKMLRRAEHASASAYLTAWLIALEVIERVRRPR